MNDSSILPAVYQEIQRLLSDRGEFERYLQAVDNKINRVDPAEQRQAVHENLVTLSLLVASALPTHDPEIRNRVIHAFTTVFLLGLSIGKFDDIPTVFREAFS